MDKPNVFAPFVGPFRYDEQRGWIIDSLGQDVFSLFGNDSQTSANDKRIAAITCDLMNAHDEPRYTVGEIIAYLRPYSNGYTAAEMITDKSVGIAAFTARNKESKS